MNQDIPGDTLKRGLSNRHIQLIALGGAVGTGLFLGVADTIRLAGPSVILGYGIAGIMAFFIMRQLSEMVVDEPVAGSFSCFANRYWGPFAGFAAGWNYWFLYVLVGMAELSAVGIYVQYWWPDVPTWVSALAFFLLVNCVNLLHVKLYGEAEFWFAIVKVAAILAMIGFGAYLLASGSGGPQASITNLWALGGFFPYGMGGMIVALAPIMFSFGGLELVGVTAAEAESPETTIPQATNQVVYRILIFYIGALAVLLSLYPWSQVQQGGSPFVLIFRALDNGWVASALNAVVLTAALSVYNSCVYSNSRMLLGLAQQGHAPRALTRVSARGIPVRALGVSAAATGSCVVLNYLMPAAAFGTLMMLAVAALIINWAMIGITHLKFRKAKALAGETTRFPSWGHPLTNYLCLAFIAGIVVIMYLTPQTTTAVFMIPAWIGLLGACYRLKRRAAARTVSSSSPA